MDFLKLAALRRSVRAYLPRPVEREKIERCLEAARLAPSACNSQPWYFIIVDDPQSRAHVVKQTFGRILPLNHFTMTAPSIAVLCCNRGNKTSRIGGMLKAKPFYLIDAGIAAEHFCLQAAEEGLGTCMLGWFREGRISYILKLPKDKRPVLLITIGYPADEQREKSRKTLDQIRRYVS